MAWEERIVEAEDREEAREIFHNWCQMKEDVHDEIEFVGRTNDVATLLVETDNSFVARDLMMIYGEKGRTPLRAIGLDAVDQDCVKIKILLAELEL